jgi:hypothetical protein
MNFLNIIVANGNVRDRDRAQLFPDEEAVLTLWPGHNKDMFDLLIILEAFKSRSQVRKNWKGPREIPPGFNMWWVGKRKRWLTIWNPTES